MIGPANAVVDLELEPSGAVADLEAASGDRRPRSSNRRLPTSERRMAVWLGRRMLSPIPNLSRQALSPTSKQQSAIADLEATISGVVGRRALSSTSNLSRRALSPTSKQQTAIVDLEAAIGDCRPRSGGWQCGWTGGRCRT